jgi:hypothetical protein
VLLGGVATATYAGTGSSLVLGHKNKASHTTVLTSKHGPALSLKAPHGTPPFAVASTTRVKHLNASLLNGKSATALESKAHVFTLNAHAGAITSFSADLAGLTRGALYQISYAVDVSSSSSLLCDITQGTTDNYDLLGYGVEQGGFVTDSVSGVARVPTSADLELVCSGDAITLVDNPGNDKTVVVATPIDVVNTSKVTATIH